MSFVRIWVHIVFSTKNREPYLTEEVRNLVRDHIWENCLKQKIFIQAINGYTDHMHCLISLGREQTIAKVSQLIKGESSHWINERKLTEIPFQWQDDYWAVSVSESQVDQVIRYINNQHEYHSRKSLEEEMDQYQEKFKNRKLL
jgi:putative transposase